MMFKRGDFIVCKPKSWPAVRSVCGVVSDIIDYWSPPALVLRDGKIVRMDESETLIRQAKEDKSEITTEARKTIDGLQ